MTCRGDDPDCSGGWKTVIEIHESKNGRRVVTETRPFGIAELSDAEKYAEAWKVFDGQTAYQAVTPCRFCKPNWVRPEDRIAEDDEDPKEGRRRKKSMWEDDEPVPTGMGRGLPE